MKKRLPRLLTQIAFLLVIGIAAACSSSDFKFKGAQSVDVTADGKPIYRLSVNNPSLSTDGRYMAFDFHEFAYIGNRYSRSKIWIGIYDLKLQFIEIFAPLLSEQDWHSPSFDREVKRLTFVSNCNRKTCPAATKGSHIAVMDIKTKKFSQITDSKQEIEIFFIILPETSRCVLLFRDSQET